MANRTAEHSSGAGGKKQAEAAEMADRAFGKLLRILRMMQSRMQQLEQEQGLSGAQLLALWQLSIQPRLRVSELASALHLKRSSTSNLLDKLETRKLVSRSRNEEDQRIVIVSLTEAGRDVVKRVPGPMGGHLRQALKTLSPQEIDKLDGGVSALLDALEPPEEGDA